jgi:hypothetical protein
MLVPDVDDGEAKRLAKKVAFAALATFGAYLTPKDHKTAPKVIHFFTGLEVVPRVGVKVKPLFATWLLPEPIGLVPPRRYGLPPESHSFGYYRQGFESAAGAAAIRARRDEYNAERRAARAAALAEQLRAAPDADVYRLLDPPAISWHRMFLDQSEIRQEARAELRSRAALRDAPPALPSPALLHLVPAWLVPSEAPERAGGTAGIMPGVTAPGSVVSSILHLTGLDEFLAANPADP